MAMHGPQVILDQVHHLSLCWKGDCQVRGNQGSWTGWRAGVGWEQRPQGWAGGGPEVFLPRLCSQPLATSHSLLTRGAPSFVAAGMKKQSQTFPCPDRVLGTVVERHLVGGPLCSKEADPVCPVSHSEGSSRVWASPPPPG